MNKKLNKEIEIYQLLNGAWYHGTHYDFDEFDIEKFGTNEKRGDYIGKAIYFSQHESTAKKYIKEENGRIIQAKLSIKNPLIVDDDFNMKDFIKNIKVPTEFKSIYGDGLSGASIQELYWYTELNADDISEYVRSEGYDGLIDLKYGQAAVISPKQINIIDSYFVSRKNNQKLKK